MDGVRRWVQEAYHERLRQVKPATVRKIAGLPCSAILGVVA
jgi:hypothetical protein